MMSINSKPVVVVVGGGFAGMTIARKISKDDRFDVALVSTRDYFEYTPSLYTAVAIPEVMAHLHVPLKETMSSGRVILGEVSEVHASYIVLSNGTKVQFDHLFICSGASYKPLGQCSTSLKRSDSDSTLVSTQALFSRTLHSKVEYVFFKRYCEMTYSVESLLYLETFHEAKKYCKGKNPSLKKAKARLAKINEEFFVRDSPNCLNLSSNMYDDGKQFFDAVSGLKSVDQIDWEFLKQVKAASCANLYQSYMNFLSIGESAYDSFLDDRIETLARESRRIQLAQTVAIVGGGPSGVEVAAKILSLHPGKQVTLIHKHKTLLSKFPPVAQSHAEDTLSKLGATLRLEEEVLGIKFLGSNCYGVRTTGEDLLEFEAVVICAGYSPNTRFLHTTDLAPLLNETGHIRVNEYGQAKDHNQIWAVGECSDLQPNMRNVETVLKMADKVCKNFLAQIAGKSLTSLSLKPSQTIITLSTIHLSLVIKDGEATKKAYAKCSKKKEDVAFAQSMRVGRASQAVSVDFEVEGPSRRNTWEVS